MKGGSIRLFELYKQVESTPKEFKSPGKILGLKHVLEKRKVIKNLEEMKNIINQSRNNQGIFREGVHQLENLKKHENYYVSGKAEGMLLEIEKINQNNLARLEKLNDKIMSYRSEYALGGVKEIEKIINENAGSRKIQLAGMNYLRKIALKHPSKEVKSASIGLIKVFLKEEKNKKLNLENLKRL